MTADDRAQIVEQLKPVLERVSNGRANVEHVAEQSFIIEDVGLASLDLLELRFELEQLWRTEISDEEAIRLRTIGDVVDLIQARIRGSSA